MKKIILLGSILTLLSMTISCNSGNDTSSLSYDSSYQESFNSSIFENSSSEEVSLDYSLEESSENSFESESSVESPTYKTLESPKLVLDNSNGLVTFDEIEGATFYRYYINEGEYQTTTNNFIQLQDGESVSFMSDSSDDYTLCSSWSEPVSYFENKSVVETINICFSNTNMSPVTINKGTAYSISTTPSKEGYIFDNWYLDPYYMEVYTPDYIFEKNTVLYANFIADECIENTTYWIKANDHITSSIQKYFSGSSWKFIPLVETINQGKKEYVATINVKGTTSTSFGQYLILDGIDDEPGRYYWKDGDSDFTLKTDGTYKISFSLEKEWLSGTNYVHANAEQVSQNYLGKVPLHSNKSVDYLSSPVVSIDKQSNLASWSLIENVEGYEYQIDNGEVVFTKDNNVSLYEGSHIVVRAISSSASYQDSLWSRPYLYENRMFGEEFYYVYFFESGLPSFKVNKNETITRPNNPTKSKYTFDNWYQDITKKTLFDFNTPITKNTIIYPKWIPLEDYKTTTYYSLLDSSKNHLGNLTLNEDCLTYNEYEINYEFTYIGNFYISRIEDGKLFGPYNISESGTYDIYFSEEHIWNVNTENARNTYYALETIDIYFTDALDWNNIYYYTWFGNGSYKSQWPGDKMNWVETNDYGQDIYKVSLPKGKYDYIIFNGNGSQTVDINISNCENNDGFYTKNEKEGSKYKVGTFNY